MLSRLFRKDKTREAATELYRDIILRARDPVFYEHLGVPDTVSGRFDMITLHMFLVLRRLRQQEKETGRFSQVLFDVMFKNMDASFREMGVGDLTVGKKVRKLAEDFYGRINAYEAALTSGEEGALGEALRRNILGEPAENDLAVTRAKILADYTLDADKSLSDQKTSRLMLGFVTFAPLPAGVADGAVSEVQAG